MFGIPAQPVLGYVSDRIAKAGYQLRVDGPAKISLLPSLNLAADDVRLRDANDVEVLSAKHVRADISLLGLLTGDVRIGELGVTDPVMRLTSGRRSGRPSAEQDNGAMGAVAIDRFTITNGTLIMRDVRENLEGRIDAIQLTASLPARGPLDLQAEGKAGGQILRLNVKANSFAQLAEGRPTPIDARLELPGLLKTPLSLSANLKTANQIVSVDGIRGTLDSGRVNGSVSIDASATKPHVRASLVVDRLDLAATEP